MFSAGKENTIVCSENSSSFNCIALFASFRCRMISKHVIKLTGADDFLLKWLKIKHVLLLIDRLVNSKDPA